MQRRIDTEKWKDPRWQKLRLEILNRDGWKCRNCGSDDKTLTVHHLKYYEDLECPWEYPDGLLVTLCEDCHATAHDSPLYIPGEIHEAFQMGILKLENIRNEFDRFFEIKFGAKLTSAWGPLV